MSADAITLARPAHRAATLAKTIIVDGERIVGKLPSPQVAAYDFREVAVDGLAELAAAVEDGARRGEIAIRGRPKAPTGRRAIYDDPEKGPAGLEVVPRSWVAFDWDGLPLDPIQAEPIPAHLADDEAEFCTWAEADPLLDGATGARHALDRLPPPFRNVTCLWQISASAGLERAFRLRTWHWLNTPITGAELKTWLAPAIKRGLVDPVTLVEAQPHYLGVRVQGGAVPCPRRFGILERDRADVPVPDIDGIRRRQEARDPAERPRCRPRPADPAGQPDAQRRVDECLERIRMATVRHTTYTREAARAKAIADRYGLDWPAIKAALVDAYESTLPAAEARRRRSFSTEGVLRWLEGRAAS